MSQADSNEIRSLIIRAVGPDIETAGFDPHNLPSDFDLKASGTLDSLALIGLLAEVAHQYGVTDDFESIDPADLTMLKPLCNYISRYANGASSIESTTAAPNTI